MASVQVVSPLPLAEQARALNSFLSHQGLTVLPEAAAYAVATTLELSAPADAKSAVQRLRTELKSHDHSLSQSHGYEALARLCGFENWMRSRVYFASQDMGLMREGFTMRLVPVAGEEGPFQPYESLPSLANEIIGSAIKRLGNTNTPVFCSLIRGRKGLRVEFEPADQLSFSFEVLAYQTLGDDVHFVDFDTESIRGFASRLERAIEMGHPGAIMSGTVMSPAHPHWYHPAYVLKSLRNQARDVMVTNEAQLFVMLEGVGLDAHTRLDAPRATVFGTSDDISIEPVWVAQEEDDAKVAPLTPAQFSSLIERFLRLKRVLRQPFSNTMMLISAGASDPKGYFAVDTARLIQYREEQGLSLETLARMADISVLDLVRIEKYGHAHESVIDKLANALGLGTGNALLPEEGEEGTGIRLDTADSLMRALSETHIWRAIFSDFFTDAERETIEVIAQNIQECGDLVQISEGVFDEVFNAKVSEVALKQSLQDSLDELAYLGVAIVVSRSLHYARGNEQAPGLQGMPMHSVTMFFEKVDKLRTPGSAITETSAGKEVRHG